MYRTDLDEQSTCKYKETVFNCKEKAKDLKLTCDPGLFVLYKWSFPERF